MQGQAFVDGALRGVKRFLPSFLIRCGCRMHSELPGSGKGVDFELDSAKHLAY